MRGMLILIAGDGMSGDFSNVKPTCGCFDYDKRPRSPTVFIMAACEDYAARLQ